MSDDYSPSSDYSNQSSPAPLPETVELSSGGSKIFRNIGLAFLFLLLLVVFTVLKLPQARVTGLMQGYLQIALDPYGIFISDRGRELSTLHGFRYTLDHPTLEFADQTRVELDSIVVSPKFLSLLQGKMGVDAEVHQGPAIINLDASGRGDKINMKVDLTQADIGKFGLLSYAAGLKGSGTVSGTIQVSGTLSDPTTLNGAIDLKLKAIKLDEQNLMGFQIPSMNISDGVIKVDITAGKLLIKTMQLGKGSDDLVLSMTGDIALNRYVNSSTLNLKTIFGISDRVRQNLALLDTIISGAKTSDGRYSYRITGTLGSPFPNPDPTAK